MTAAIWLIIFVAMYIGAWFQDGPSGMDIRDI